MKLPQIQKLHLDSGLTKSIAAHFLIFALVWIKSFAFPEKSIRVLPTLKVDLVDLPDVLKKDLTLHPQSRTLSPEVQKVLEKSQPSQKEEMTTGSLTTNREQKNRRALEKIKALAKIQDFSDTEKQPKPQLIKGNQISKGSSLSGDARESLEENYLNVLRDRLSENWTLPPWIARQNLDATVRLYIDSTGKIRSFRFAKPSGNTQFDNAVSGAVHASQPFPPPPSVLQSTLLINGILVGFPI